jgi:shikimate dehydrogenase
MIRLGLIGYPVGHSLSPRIQNAALQSCSLEGEYVLFPVPPDDHNGLRVLLDQVRAGLIHGLNVTIPHKQNVIPLMDELTATAKAIGAVNIIYIQNNKLIGDNTDAAGFLADLEKLTAETQRHEDSKALVLGAGGSARSVVYALQTDHWSVTVAARRIEQAHELAGQFENLRTMELNLRNLQDAQAELIVNTTPLGMTPNVDQSPWPDELPFPKDAAIYDLVYNPRETKLFKAARAQGLRSATGLGMLLEQAALGFEVWTGHKPSREILRAAVQESPVSNT